MFDFSQTKFRASSWGNLLTDPVTKAAKEAGELSKSCQTELIKIYNEVVYGRKKDITTKQMEKGLQCEQDGIDLYSKVEGRLYYKNEERLENDFFTGHPDVFAGDNILNADEVDDMKLSWDLDTFMVKLNQEPDNGYVSQLNVYFDLCGCQSGHIVYALVSAPPNIVEDEKRKLLYRMNVATELNPEYLEAAAELERNLVFDDIDYRERIIKIPVSRNDELIQKMKDKVPVLRSWLQKFHEKHMNLYPKQ